MPQGAPNEKTLQQRRRFARQLEEVEQLVTTIDSAQPGCLQQPPDLAAALPGVHSPVNWDQLPAFLDPGGVIKADGDKDHSKQAARVRRKQLQVETFAVVLAHFATSIKSAQQRTQQAAAAADHTTSTSDSASRPGGSSEPCWHVVDFGCGTGNLLLPLAATFPQWRFTGVDMKPAALTLLQQRAASAGLTNVGTFAGMIEQYSQTFDLGLALHACGNATDRVLQLCCHHRAAFLVSPCCIGKLRFSLQGGSSFHAHRTQWTPQVPGDKSWDRAAVNSQRAGGQESSADAAGEAAVAGPGSCISLPELSHPRSAWLQQLLPDAERHFRLLAKVADVCHSPAEQQLLTGPLAARADVARRAKRAVELDRAHAAAQEGYMALLLEVLGAQQMAKTDLLLGVPTENQALAEVVRSMAASGRCGVPVGDACSLDAA